MARPLRSREASPPQGQAKGEGKGPNTKPWEDPEDFDASVAWEAELLQPIGRLTPGSVQPLVVQVSAPVSLDDQPVEFFYDGGWKSADWTGEVGRVRQAAMMIEARPGAIHRVRVRVRSGPQLPVLDVGLIRVNRR